MVIVTNSSWLPLNLSVQYTEKSVGPGLKINIGCICSNVPNVQFQKISILPQQKGLEFPEGWG